MKSQIKTYNFKSGLPQEFEILDFSDLYQNAKYSLTRAHRTEFYHIIWFQEGNPTHYVDFNPIKIIPNTLLFLDKDIVQRFDPDIQFKAKIILFTDHFFCRTEFNHQFLRNSILFNDLFGVSKIEMNNDSKLFGVLLCQMIDELKVAKDSLQADILKNLLHNFLLSSEREKRSQSEVTFIKDADFDCVMQFRELLENNYKNHKTVSFYTKQIITSEKKLNDATKKILGKSPKRIIDERMMLEAKRILANTTESVKEICYNLGFEEPTNFIKYFKKHSGTTPIDFRRNHFYA